MIVDGYASSVHVRRADVAAVKSIFERHAQALDAAYLAPPVNEWAAFYPKQCDTAPQWAERLSRELVTDTVAFQIIEDEVFTYHLYRNGQLEDAYVSRPSYFLGHDPDLTAEKIKAMRGRPEAWEGLLPEGKTASEVAHLLKTAFDTGGGGSSGEYVIPRTMVEELASIVGIVGAGTTFGEVEEMVAEWSENVEDADEGEDIEEPDCGCGRAPGAIAYVRAARKRVGTR